MRNIFAGVMCAGLLGGLFAVSALAADWPQFRGPDRSGISPEAGLARAWPQAGPRILWTVDVNIGFAGAVVRDGEVYLLDRVDEKQDVLRCLDLRDGKELWRFAYDAPGSLPYPGSRNVSTVDEQFVYTVGPLGHVHCISRKTHAPVWSAHLVNDFKDPAIDVNQPPKNRAEKLARAQMPEWGLTQSPLILGDLLILAPQTQKVGLAAYDKATGKLRWTSPYIGRNWYSHVSPVLMRFGGVDQIIMIAQPSDPEKAPAAAPPGIVSSADPATGRILWSIQTPRPCKIPIPLPVQIAEDRLLITGGYTTGCLILGVQRSGETWATHWLSATTVCAGHIHSPVVYKGCVYVTSFRDQKGGSSGLVCLDGSGRLRWQTGPKLQFENGAFLIADDLAFVMHGNSGELYLLQIGSDGYRLLSKAKVLAGDGKMVWAPMALADGKLIVRDQHQMKCLDVRGR